MAVMGTKKSAPFFEKAALAANYSSYDDDNLIIRPGPQKTTVGICYYWNYGGTGDLVATIKLQTRPDRDEAWIDVNEATFPNAGALATGSGSDEVSFSLVADREYQIVITFSSGDGDVKVFLDWSV